MSTRPSIFQLLLVAFAVLSVGFVGVATVVAVSTAPSVAPVVETVPAAAPIPVTAQPWSTAMVAERFGVARGALTAH